MNEQMEWTDEAKEALEKVPGFVRDVAKQMIEDFGRDEGATEIDKELMKRARAKFGM